MLRTKVIESHQHASKEVSPCTTATPSERWGGESHPDETEQSFESRPVCRPSHGQPRVPDSTRFISGQPWNLAPQQVNSSTVPISLQEQLRRRIRPAPRYVRAMGTTRARTGRKGRKHRLKSVKRVTRAHTHPTLPNPTQLDPPGVFLPLLSNAIRLAPPIACDPTFTCCCPCA